MGVFAVGFILVKIIGEFSPWQLSDAISPEQAQKQISGGALILDVRLHDDFVAGHIEGSLWMPLENLESLMKTLPHDRLIITVCNSGVRSIQAMYILKEAGYTQVTSMTGGMQAWVAADFPVITGEPMQVY
ncbi:MAG: hypothetical protein A3K46_07390 [Chloroflexi bacterium RBG_13_60_9]|nr:MAG: hypothetical protein A3K46_07390 [Chloroflexi bacterium RBG_13_60_9]